MGAVGAHGFLKEETVVVLIDAPGIDPDLGSTEAHGINNGGQIVGSFIESPIRRRGFLKDGPTFTPIDFPGAMNTDAFGINDVGQIVGAFEDTTGIHGFLKTGDSFMTIDAPGAFLTAARGINNAGQIVGVFREPLLTGSRFHGFLATPVFTVPSKIFDAKVILSMSTKGNDHFFAKGSFTLGEASDGIDPLAESVVFSLADPDGTFFDQTLPPGSFEPFGKRGFLFRAPKGSTGIRLMIIKPTTSAGEFTFEILGKKLDLSGTDNPPVTVSLQIGNDAGSETLPCRNSSKALICR